METPLQSMFLQGWIKNNELLICTTIFMVGSSGKTKEELCVLEIPFGLVYIWL